MSLRRSATGEGEPAPRKVTAKIRGDICDRHQSRSNPPSNNKLQCTLTRATYPPIFQTRSCSRAPNQSSRARWRGGGQRCRRAFELRQADCVGPGRALSTCGRSIYLAFNGGDLHLHPHPLVERQAYLQVLKLICNWFARHPTGVGTSHRHPRLAGYGQGQVS
jgi:hypothetical protein